MDESSLSSLTAALHHQATNGTPSMTLLRLKHVNKFFDRHGKLRHYFRRRGMRKGIPLPGLPGSEEFMAA